VTSPDLVLEVVLKNNRPELVNRHGLVVAQVVLHEAVKGLEQLSAGLDLGHHGLGAYQFHCLVSHFQQQLLGAITRDLRILLVHRKERE